MARDGDEVAFEELLKRNYQSSIRLASMILRGRPEAEDAVLQAAYKAYAGLHGFENRSKFSSWINQIVVNECLSVLRKARKVELVPIEDVDRKPAGPRAASYSPMTPEEEVSNRQIECLIRAEMRRIPELLRRPLILRYVQELSISEIAGELGVSHSAVKSRLARGRAELHGLLRRHLPLDRTY